MTLCNKLSKLEGLFGFFIVISLEEKTAKYIWDVLKRKLFLERKIFCCLGP